MNIISSAASFVARYPGGAACAITGGLMGNRLAEDLGLRFIIGIASSQGTALPRALAALRYIAVTTSVETVTSILLPRQIQILSTFTAALLAEFMRTEGDLERTCNLAYLAVACSVQLLASNPDPAVSIAPLGWLAGFALACFWSHEYDWGIQEFKNNFPWVAIPIWLGFPIPFNSGLASFATIFSISAVYNMMEDSLRNANNNTQRMRKELSDQNERHWQVLRKVEEEASDRLKKMTDENKALDRKYGELLRHHLIMKQELGEKMENLRKEKEKMRDLHQSSMTKITKLKDKKNRQEHENRRTIDRLTDNNADLAWNNKQLRDRIEFLERENNTLSKQNKMTSLGNTISSWCDDDPILSLTQCVISLDHCVAPVLDPDGNSFYEEDQILHYLKSNKVSPTNRQPLTADRLNPMPKLNALLKLRLEYLKNCFKKLSNREAIREAYEEFQRECPALASAFDDLLTTKDRDPRTIDALDLHKIKQKPRGRPSLEYLDLAGRLN